MPDINYIFNRRNSFYKSRCSVWDKSRLAYQGGDEYISASLVQHCSELDSEFTERKSRAVYFNYPRRIARIIANYVLSDAPIRTDADPVIVEDFTNNGIRADEFFRQLLTLLNVYGVAWCGVDMPAFSGEIDLETKQAKKIRPYAVCYSPLEVTDWSFDSNGKLDWIIIAETASQNIDPYSCPVSVVRRRLWTKKEWALFEQRDNADPVLVESGLNSIGEVPFFQIVEIDGYGLSSGHWFDDVVKISDSILNHESEAQMNIIKQMFGILVLPERFMFEKKINETETEAKGKWQMEISRSVAITEMETEKGITRYISPEGTTTEAITNEINRLRSELHSVVGLAMARRGNSAETAESKAWDFQDVQMFLASRADMMEQAEAKTWNLINRWDKLLAVPKIAYNRQFAVYDLLDTVNAALQLSTVPAGKEFERHIARIAVKLSEKIARLTPKQKELIEKEIESEDFASSTPIIEEGG